MRIRNAVRHLGRIGMTGLVVAGLVTVGLVPAGPAAASGGLVYTVESTSAHQGYQYCADPAPSACTAVGHGQLYLLVSLNTSHTQADVHYLLVDGTAHINVDYYGPANGEEIISSSPSSPEQGLIDVPLYLTNTQVSKTFQVTLTSVSPNGVHSSVGTETILPGTQIPADCAMNLLSNKSMSLSCTGRPAGQQWYLSALCYHGFAGDDAIGNTVTGNGTSTATCGSIFTMGDSGDFNVV